MRGRRRQGLDAWISPVGTGWRRAVGDTDVVWAYGNENESQPFKHLEIAHPEPTTAFVVDFVIRIGG